MKNINNFWLSLIVFVAFCNFTSAQTALGTSKNFLSSLKKELVSSTSRGTGVGVSLKVSDTKNFDAKVNYKKSDLNTEFLIGEIKNVAESSFYVKVIDKSVEGHIILQATKEAYKYYSDEKGDVYVNKVDINSLICINNDFIPQTTKSTNKTTQAKIAAALLDLQSLPGAAGCVMLDFDGYNMPAGNLWNQGNAINAAGSGMDDANIQRAWEIVAEDYRPFNVNITTNEAVFNSYPKNRRMRVVITTTTTAAPRSGGVAYIGSFNWDNDVPCWVYNLGGKAGGDTCSHELGHTLDLQHDGRISPAETYFSGISGTPWGPIMGATFSVPVAQWSKGEYNSANNQQDDVATISGSKFGLGYRADDYGNTTGAASNLAYGTSGAVIQTNGIITSEADVDYFSFTTGGGNVALNVNTVARDGDLDVVLRLYNASGAIIGTYTNTTAGALNASLAVNLAAGKYFLAVDGTGAGDARTGGYSAYASIGSYSITGTIPPGSGTTDTQIPTTPTNLIASGTTATATNLAWNASTDNVGVTAYNVYKGTALAGTVAGTTYTASGLTASTAYSFSVRAIDAAGNISVASNTVNVTTGTVVVTPPINAVIGLKGNNGKYVSSESGLINMTCNRTVLDTWEKFEVVNQGNGKIALKGNNGKYISSESGVATMNCNRTSIQAWEIFDLINLGGGFVAMKGNNGLYVSSQNGVGGMTCTSASVGTNERFNWVILSLGSGKPATATAETTAIVENIVSYPNPFENEINFSSNEKLNASAVKLLNVLGQSQDIVLENTNENQYKVNIKNNPASGIYFLKIETPNGEKTMKVFKK